MNGQVARAGHQNKERQDKARTRKGTDKAPQRTVDVRHSSLGESEISKNRKAGNAIATQCSSQSKRWMVIDEAMRS